MYVLFVFTVVFELKNCSQRRKKRLHTLWLNVCYSIKKREKRNIRIHDKCFLPVSDLPCFWGLLLFLMQPKPPINGDGDFLKQRFGQGEVDPNTW